jgi:hypothetical protein
MDLGIELLSKEQADDLQMFEGKERMLEKLEVSNAPENKLAAFRALFEK